MKTLLLLFLLTSVSFAQDFKAHSYDHYNSIADSIISASLTEQKGFRLLPELSALGSRLSASESSYDAMEWAKQKMIEWNFDSVWMQPVMVPHWERGKIEECEISSSSDHLNKKLNVASLGRSVGTDSDGITAEILEVRSFEELQERKNEAKGKIIFFNKPWEDQHVNTFKGYGIAVQPRSQGAIEAAKVGGVAALVRSATHRMDDVPHVGAMSAYVDSLDKVPAMAISLVGAEFLSQALRTEPNLKITLKSSAINLPDKESFNVIGEIKGSEFPNEIIVAGGHFDAWDKGDGAHDDGAPSIQTMEVVELMKRLRLKPKRTIRCVLFANEENGLRGGLKYGEYAANSDEIHVAAIESDRGAFTPRGFSTTADSSKILKMKSWLPILNKTLIDWVRPGGSGADIGRIKNAQALIGFVPDMQRYFDYHHSENDIWTEVHPREMQLGTAAITLLAYIISEEGF
ncbi:MAG: M28 family peptidase [Melioribacteraceae bacterium]|nr:M28 family peptidase [Melioribacteraceae bacterium]MCF8265253.1 M28 family peptidase [Melioribacteraceae bacterium]